MPFRSRDEVWSYAEGVNKLIRARKHLENRGAEKACIRLLQSLIKTTEREFFNHKSAALPIGAMTAGSVREGSRLGDSIRPLTKHSASNKPRPSDK
jgi:hypothetical protein